MKKLKSDTAFWCIMWFISIMLTIAITVVKTSNAAKKHYKEVIETYDNYYYCAEHIIDDMWEHDSNYYLDVIAERDYYLHYINANTKIQEYK